MNKIKQTQLNLESIRNIYNPKVEVTYLEESEELLQQTNQLLNQVFIKQPLSKHSKFLSTNIKIQTQLHQYQMESNLQLKQLQLLLQTLPKQNDDHFQIRMHLIHSFMQKNQIDYFQIQEIRKIFSYHEKTRHNQKSGRKVSQFLSVSKLGGLLLDEYQQQIYKIFDTKEQIYFIFRNEMDLTIKRHRHQMNYHIYRDDKDTFEAILIENHIEEEQNNQAYEIKQENNNNYFKFTFLNNIVNYNLNPKSNVPPVLLRQLNIYLILKELILDAIDHLHIKQIGPSIIHQKDNIFSDFSENYNVLPSQYYKDNRTMLSTPQEASDSDISTETKVRQVERKVKNLVTKIRRIKRIERENAIDHLCIIQPESLKDYKLNLIPGNQSYQAQRAIKDQIREIQNKKLPAGFKQPKGAIDRIQRAEQFFKRKGQKEIYHICWLEMRGFYLVWYHDKLDKEARGIGQLDDVQIKDDGLINDQRIYHVKLLDRLLTFKLDKPIIGAIWRKLLANQIAYKTYLNTLWLYCRQQDRCPNISLIDYFFNENYNELNLSDKTLYISPNLPLIYTLKYSSIIFDSILYHTKLEKINLRNSKVGPIAITKLIQLLSEKRVHNRIKLLDFSNCQMNIQSIQLLCKYLMNENSFGLNQLYLDDNLIGDQAINLLSQSIKERYEQFWDGHQDEQVPQRKQAIKSKSIQSELELIRVMSFKNMGIVQFDSLFDAIEAMIQLATDFSHFQVKGDNITRTISKLQNQSDQYTQKNLSLICQLYDGVDAQYHGIIKIINMHIDISSNPIMSLHSLRQIILNRDCFRSIALQNLQQIQPEEFVDFIKCLEDSLSLEMLDIRNNLFSLSEISQILEQVSNNYSINLLNLSISKENRELFEDIEGYQFFIAEAAIFNLFKCRRKQLKVQLPEETNSKEFLSCAKQARSLRDLSREQMLLVYALYKQAVMGDCNLPEPYRLNFEDHAKWVAWVACKGIVKEEAERQYIRTVELLKCQEGEDIDDDEPIQQGMGQKVSTMKAGEYDTNEGYQQKMNVKSEMIEQIILDEKEQQLFQQIEQALDKPEDLENILNGIDPEILEKLLKAENHQSITLLHSVVDEENEEAFLILVPYYTKFIDIRERISGMTALHYACLTENENIIRKLIEMGSDPNLKDFSGCDGFENIGEQLKHLLQK